MDAPIRNCLIDIYMREMKSYALAAKKENKLKEIFQSAINSMDPEREKVFDREISRCEDLCHIKETITTVASRYFRTEIFIDSCKDIAFIDDRQLNSLRVWYLGYMANKDCALENLNNLEKTLITTVTEVLRGEKKEPLFNYIPQKDYGPHRSFEKKKEPPKDPAARYFQHSSTKEECGSHLGGVFDPGESCGDSYESDDLCETLTGLTFSQTPNPDPMEEELNFYF